MEKHNDSLSSRRKFLDTLKEKVKNSSKIENTTAALNSFDNSNISLEGQSCSGYPLEEDNDFLKNYDVNFLYCNETLPLLEDDPFHNSDNSKDRDYVPENDTESDVSDTIISSPVNKMFTIDKKFLHSKKTYQNYQEPPLIREEIYAHTTQNNYNIQCCEYKDCANGVFSTCGQCLSLLCYAHFENETMYNDCENHIHTQIDNEVVVKSTLIEKKKTKKVNKEKVNQNIVVEENYTQCCEYVDCKQIVQSSCESCLCLLCLDHFQTQDSENCKNHYVVVQTTIKPVKSNKNKKQRKEKEPFKKTYFDEDIVQHCEYSGCTQKVGGSCEKCFSLLCHDHYAVQSNNILCESHNPCTTGPIRETPVFTRQGNVRKRKLYEENIQTRKEKKKVKIQEKNALKEPCETSCKKQCSTKFNENQRKQIHQEYNTLNYEAQGLFIRGMVELNPVKTRKQNAITQMKRNAIYSYHLQTSENVKNEVCKTFFLATLGYNTKNDRRVITAMKKPINQQKDRRGSFLRKTKIDSDLIRKHVMKYEPCVAHYRREHAPNRLYLPSDINIYMMYKDFCSQHAHITISCESYRKIVRNDLNISFAHLGHEECEQCAIFQQHDFKSHEEDNCEVCSKYKEHKSKYTTSRKEYKKDTETAISGSNQDTIFKSVDLQKVIMLPRIDQFKAAIFCPRIIAFNESFVPLGPTTDNNKPFAVLWNETVSGRNQEDIISAFRAFLIDNRDMNHVVLWMDNCSAQNKNWALFTFLLDIINSDLIATETITFKYFEPGHSFMSADSFHHQVELVLKRKGKIYDFEDFIDAVKLSNSKKNTVHVMNITEFYNYRDLSSQARLRKLEPRVYLKDIVYIKAERGNFTLKYKLHHDDQSENTLDFLMFKYVKSRKLPDTESKFIPRGIAATRKAEIIQKLVPLMPENRRQFWFDLPISETN